MDSLRKANCFPHQPDVTTMRDEFDARSHHLVLRTSRDQSIIAYGRLTPGPFSVIETWSEGRAELPSGLDVLDFGRFLVTEKYRRLGLHELLCLIGFDYARMQKFNYVVAAYLPGHTVEANLMRVGFKKAGPLVDMHAPQVGIHHTMMQPIICDVNDESNHDQWAKLNRERMEKLNSNNFRLAVATPASSLQNQTSVEDSVLPISPPYASPPTDLTTEGIEPNPGWICQFCGKHWTKTIRGRVDAKTLTECPNCHTPRIVRPVGGQPHPTPTERPQLKLPNGRENPVYRRWIRRQSKLPIEQREIEQREAPKPLLPIPTERPKTRLPDGSKNPLYGRWLRHQNTLPIDQREVRPKLSLPVPIGRPNSKLPNGKVNPLYGRWWRHQKTLLEQRWTRPIVITLPPTKRPNRYLPDGRSNPLYSRWVRYQRSLPIDQRELKPRQPLPVPTERPERLLPNGRVNPVYERWVYHQKKLPPEQRQTRSILPIPTERPPKRLPDGRPNREYWRWQYHHQRKPLLSINQRQPKSRTSHLNKMIEQRQRLTQLNQPKKNPTSTYRRVRKNLATHLLNNLKLQLSNRNGNISGTCETPGCPVTIDVCTIYHLDSERKGIRGEPNFRFETSKEYTIDDRSLQRHRGEFDRMYEPAHIGREVRNNTIEATGEIRLTVLCNVHRAVCSFFNERRSAVIPMSERRLEEVESPTTIPWSGQKRRRLMQRLTATSSPTLSTNLLIAELEEEKKGVELSSSSTTTSASAAAVTTAHQRTITKKSTKKRKTQSIDVKHSDEALPAQFTVECIIGKKLQPSGIVKYLVKWLDYDRPEDNTWEPLGHLENAKEAVEEFEQKLKRAGLQVGEEPLTESLPEMKDDDDNVDMIDTTVTAPTNPATSTVTSNATPAAALPCHPAIRHLKRKKPPSSEENQSVHHDSTRPFKLPRSMDDSHSIQLSTSEPIPPNSICSSTD